MSNKKPLASPVEGMAVVTATDVNKGWKQTMQLVRERGSVIVRNHDKPEAVILKVEEYEAIYDALDRAGAIEKSILDSLSEKFDERLASLRDADAAAKLDDIMDDPVELDGKLKVGAGR